MKITYRILIVLFGIGATFLCLQPTKIYADTTGTVANFADEPPPDTPDTLVYQLDEVVVTAFNRTQQIVSIPGSLSHIGAVQIARKKLHYNILPLLEQAPGVFAHTGATNTSRVSIRGVGARVPYATGKIRAYFNNIPLTNTSGVTFIQDIDPAVVESMDIIKGPATSIYGAGLGGTITLQARQPSARRSGLSNTLTMGSYGLFRNSLAGDWVSDDFATGIVYSHTQSGGYRQNNEFRRDAITSVSQFKLMNHTDVTALLAFSDLKSHIPSSVDSATWNQDPRAAAQNWLKTEGFEDSRRFLGGISATTEARQNLTFDVSLFTIWHDEKEMRPFDVFYEERTTLGTRFTTRYRRDIQDVSLELTTGGEFFYEDYRYSNFENIDGEGVQGSRISDNREYVGRGNAFVQSDADIGSLQLSGGVNFNFTQIDYRDMFHDAPMNRSGKYDYGVIVSPRISANYRYHTSNAVFVTLSHGFSPPSLAETLTPEGFINPEIRPEKSWNLEMGVRGDILDRMFYYDVSIYQMQVQDLLVAERVAEDAWVGKNAGESRHTGVEAEFHWVALRNPQATGLQMRELSLRGNYTYNYFVFTDFVDFDNDYSGNRIPGVPDQVFYVNSYIESGGGLYAKPALRRVGVMHMNDANTRETAPYMLVDLVLGYKRVLSDRWDLDMFFRVDNVLSEKYASMILVNAPSFGNAPPRYYYPGLPRNYALGLKISIR